MHQLLDGNVKLPHEDFPHVAAGARAVAAGDAADRKPQTYVRIV